MNKLLLLFLISGITSAWAQENYYARDILVSNDDLKETTFSNDTTANAFYIYEKGSSKFQNGGDYNLLTDYSAKIKILNPEGYDHSNIQIRLHKSKSGKEKLHKLEGTTYYLKGGVKKEAKLLPSMIFTEENETYDLVKFTFPSLTPGAVLVYSYQKESPFIFNYHPWWFQDEIPKIYSVYETSIPGNYNYSIKKMGELQLDFKTSEIKKRCFRPTGASKAGDCITAVYAMKNIPAFIEEPYLTSRYNFISRIEYELIGITNLEGIEKKYTKSWKDVDNELKFDKDLGRQLKRISLVKDLLPQELQQKPNDLVKAKEIFSFIKKNFTWNGEYKIYSPMNLKDVLKDKAGNVSSLNILMHNVFEEQGFRVLPVMSSTRSNGTPNKLYPVLSEFNYMMVQIEVENQKYLLDATEKNVDFGQIPFRSLNHYARLIDFDNGSSWIDLVPGNNSGIVIIDSLKVNPDGTAQGISEHIFKGYHALLTRNNLEKLSPNEIFEKIPNRGSFTRSSNTKVKNKEEVSEHLHITFDLANETQKINNAIFLNPFSFKFFDKNPFQRNSRHYPIDFGYADAYSYIIHIEIPENFKIEEMPDQKLFRLPEGGGVFQFFAQQNGERNLTIQCRVSFPKSLYSSEFYPYLKDFFAAVIEVQAQSLIVIKENS